MPKGKSKYLPLGALSVDLFLLIGAFFSAYLMLNGSMPSTQVYYYDLLGACVLWVVIALKRQLFDWPRILYLDKIVYQNFKTWLLFVVLTAALLFVSKDLNFSRLFFGMGQLMFFLGISCWRILMVGYVKGIRKEGLNYRNILIVGDNERTLELYRQILSNSEHSYRIKGVFNGNHPPANELKRYYRGTLEEIPAFCKQTPIDEMFVSLAADKTDQLNSLIAFAENNLIRISVIPEFSGRLNQFFNISYQYHTPVLNIRREPLEDYSNRLIKRGFDVVFSLLVIFFIFSWLFPVLAVAVKLSSKGPVFFKQKRSGKYNGVFNCYKFRSMEVNDVADIRQASKGDPRITRVGAFMRKTNLDELPQFFNVLWGDMSVVGPRPHMVSHTAKYRKLVDKYMVRHYAKPGVSGWAQVQGFRGETKTTEQMKQRAEADIWYIENWNLFLDFKIITMTVIQMLTNNSKNAF